MTVQVVSQEERDLSQIVRMIRQLAEGRNNAHGSFSCISNVASTHIIAVNCAPASHVSLTPTSSSAAVEIGNGTAWISSVVAGSFYVSHASTTSNRSFTYVAVG